MLGVTPFKKFTVEYFERHLIGDLGRQLSLTRRKYNVRCIGEQRIFREWRGSRKCFLVLVELRNAETHMPLIQKFRAMGSTVVMDCWSAYNGISRLSKVRCT